MIDERIVKYQQGELSTEEVAQLLNDAEQDAEQRCTLLLPIVRWEKLSCPV